MSKELTRMHIILRFWGKFNHADVMLSFLFDLGLYSMAIRYGCR